MIRLTRSPITLLFAGLVIVAAGYVAILLPGDGSTARELGAWALALGASLVLTGMLALAAARPAGTPRMMRAATWLTFLATFGGLAYALAAPAPVTDGPLLLGLPRVTAIMLLLTGLVPLIALPLAYAHAFDRDVLSREDVSRLMDAERQPDA